jgi:Fe-S-cluster containining protein
LNHATKNSEGTFAFCAGCRAENNCCIRAREHGYIETPFLLNKEKELIEIETGRAANEFAFEYENGLGSFFALKHDNGKCIFNRNGKCGIYTFRPFDCRIFPFDIVQKFDRKFYWVVYLDLCPPGLKVPTKYQKYFSSVKTLFASMHLTKDELEKFASHGAKEMSDHKYDLLEEVRLET